MANRREIRNSTTEFLIFQIEGKGQALRPIIRIRLFGVLKKLWVCYLTVQRTI